MFALIPRMGDAQTLPGREDGESRFRDSGGMEAITTTLQPLAWVLSPAGLVVALSSFGLVVSGVIGRVFPDIEVSGSAWRSRRRQEALEGAARRARITE